MDDRAGRLAPGGAFTARAPCTPVVRNRPRRVPCLLRGVALPGARRRRPAEAGALQRHAELPWGLAREHDPHAVLRFLDRHRAVALRLTLRSGGPRLELAEALPQAPDPRAGVAGHVGRPALAEPEPLALIRGEAQRREPVRLTRAHRGADRLPAVAERFFGGDLRQELLDRVRVVARDRRIALRCGGAAIELIGGIQPLETLGEATADPFRVAARTALRMMPDKYGLTERNHRRDPVRPSDARLTFGTCLRRPRLESFDPRGPSLCVVATADHDATFAPSSRGTPSITLARA
jgi:hypothetical protein